jgi:alpha/beta superfamily hydrolase
MWPSSASAAQATVLYNAQVSHPAVKKAILISMNPILTNHADFKKAHDAINAKAPANKIKLMSFSLGYCKNNFFTTASSYLSYAQHSEQKMLALITTTPVETEFIFGSSDTILPLNWPEKIKALQTQPRVVVIENANHFFEDTFEFDLAEIVENSLKNIPAQ